MIGSPNSPWTGGKDTVKPQGSTGRPIVPSLRRKLAIKLAALIRWLHIYLSMLGLGAILFFSVTGITLNHPDWFPSGPERSSESRGRMRPEWLKAEPPAENPRDREEGAASHMVDKLAIVEYLRSAHGIRGALSEFNIDEQECVVSFKGPGYSADTFIERDSGDYRITETQHSLISILNDLHKGRDTGSAWSWVIDISAVMLTISSLSGMILLLYIKRRRRLGLLTGILGSLVLVATVMYLVP